MRTLIALALGIVIGAAALGAVWATQHGDETVRITAVRHDDGSVEVGLQQFGRDAEWHALTPTRYRFLAADAAVGQEFHSSPIVVPVETQSERAASDYNEYLLDEGEGIGRIFDQYFASQAEEGEAEPSALLCIVDPNDAGVEALCEGIERSYTSGAVERIEFADWDALRAELEVRFSDGSIGAVVTTSVPTTILAMEVEEATGQWLPWIYWIELLDQHLAPSDALFCLISHSGQVIEEEGQDLFWGLASEVSAAAAAQLGVNLEFSAHSNAADQAAAIQECVTDEAAVIATTLVEPDVLSPAIEEAVAAEIPVVSFNSGAEIAGQAGTALHIALDDHEAGRLAGEEFNRRAIEGTVLCVIHEPNNVGLHDRCDGFEAVYQGSVERWSAEDPTAVFDELGVRLGEGDVSAILTLSVHSAWEARVTRSIHGIDVPIAAFGFSVGLASSVIDGSVMFTILDHPELQTYMSAVASVIVERWRLDPQVYFNGMTMLISPQIADAEYMQRLIDTMYTE